MIVIQNFPTMASLVGFLHNARLRCGKHNFAEWLARYTVNRELVVNNKVFRYRDCINLMKEDALNV